MARDANYIRLISCWRWTKLRRWKLRQNPFCEECEKRECYVPATQVHHIVPIEGHVPAEMERLAYDKSNLMSLCAECHQRIHKEMHSHKITKEHRQELVKNDVDNILNNLYGKI